MTFPLFGAGFLKWVIMSIVVCSRVSMRRAQSTSQPILTKYCYYNVDEFRKEKRDKFKRSILPGTSRRWFTIERIPNSNNGSGEPSEELELCYYKRASSDKTQRCGWLFLNDVLSLSQDIPNRWITIEHPTRILRLQSPTPAQVNPLDCCASLPFSFYYCLIIYIIATPHFCIRAHSIEFGSPLYQNAASMCGRTSYLHLPCPW